MGVVFGQIMANIDVIYRLCVVSCKTCMSEHDMSVSVHVFVCVNIMCVCERERNVYQSQSNH